MTLAKHLTSFVPLALVVVGLLGYNFISAQWQSPTATAPNNNTEAPINISANYQAKLGDLGAVRMRAGEYCDAAGENCVTGSDLGVSLNCSLETQTLTACDSYCATGWNVLSRMQIQADGCGNSEQRPRYQSYCGRVTCG